VVTLFWSGSFVLIKWGLEDWPPLTFVAARYFLGSLLLLAINLAVRKQEIAILRGGQWVRLLGIGVIGCALGQVLLYTCLGMLPAVTIAVLMTFIPVAVLLLGLIIGDYPSGLQVLGVGIAIIGTLVFYPVEELGGDLAGIGLSLAAVLAFAISTVLTRSLSKAKTVGAVWLTIITLGVGGLSLLPLAILVEGVPAPSARGWGIMLLLVFFCTALAYVLWNHALGTLKAFELGAIANFQPLEVALLGWVFLGEGLTWRMILGMLIVILGVTVVQIHSRA
jgi:drug/metabolite transporter (DMT)-like permease